jgi:hypothetical protein
MSGVLGHTGRSFFLTTHRLVYVFFEIVLTCSIVCMIILISCRGEVLMVRPSSIHSNTNTNPRRRRAYRTSNAAGNDNYHSFATPNSLDRVVFLVTATNRRDCTSAHACARPRGWAGSRPMPTPPPVDSRSGSSISHEPGGKPGMLPIWARQTPFEAGLWNSGSFLFVCDGSPRLRPATP